MGRDLEVFICDNEGAKITRKVRNEKWEDATLPDTCDMMCTELLGLNSYYKRYYGKFTLAEIKDYITYRAEGIAPDRLLTAGLNFDFYEPLQELYFLAYVYRTTLRFNEYNGTEFTVVEFTYE